MEPQHLFEILMRDHADTLTVYLRSVVRDSSLVDDLFQETMLVAWRNLDVFDRTRPFGPWLRGIAAKLILAQRRKSARDVLFFDEATLEHMNQRLHRIHRQPGDTLDERLDLLRRCIEALPDAYRETVELRYRHDLNLAGLAERLSLAAETVKKRLQRARARLLECVQRKLAAAEVK